MSNRLSGPKRLAKSQPFHQSANTLLERHTNRREFIMDWGAILPDANTDDQTTF